MGLEFGSILISSDQWVAAACNNGFKGMWRQCPGSVGKYWDQFAMSSLSMKEADRDLHGT